jgi:integrase
VDPHQYRALGGLPDGLHVALNSGAYRHFKRGSQLDVSTWQRDLENLSLEQFDWITAPGVIRVLEVHRTSQALERAKDSDWKDQDFVFASEVGTDTHPRNLERVFFAQIKHAELKRIRFHDLRHTAASLMIAKGVSPKLVSRVLRHASVASTLQVYVHVFEEQETGVTLDLEDLE